MKPTLSVEVSAALAGLQKRWPELTSDVDKASAVYTVYCLKVSARVLAENLGCSATLIRNLLRVAKAPAADKFLARKGKIGTRELLRRSKVAAKLTEAKDLEALDKKRTKLAQEGAKIIGKWLCAKMDFFAVRRESLKRRDRFFSATSRAARSRSLHLWRQEHRSTSSSNERGRPGPSIPILNLQVGMPTGWHAGSSLPSRMKSSAIERST